MPLLLILQLRLKLGRRADILVTAAMRLTSFMFQTLTLGQAGGSGSASELWYELIQKGQQIRPSLTDCVIWMEIWEKWNFSQNKRTETRQEMNKFVHVSSKVFPAAYHRRADKKEIRFFCTGGKSERLTRPIHKTMTISNGASENLAVFAGCAGHCLAGSAGLWPGSKGKLPC